MRTKLIPRQPMRRNPQPRRTKKPSQSQDSTVKEVRYKHIVSGSLDDFHRKLDAAFITISKSDGEITSVSHSIGASAHGREDSEWSAIIVYAQPTVV